MLALKITNTKEFMKKLLTTATFDSFLLSEGYVTTFTTIRFDGTWHPEYFGKNNSPTQSGSNRALLSGLSWSLVRPFFLDIIKGKFSPIFFRIILKLDLSNTQNFLKNNLVPIEQSSVSGLFLNFTYSSGTVQCTTGTSLKTFTKDKSLDKAWEEAILKFFSSLQIAYLKM